MKPHNICTIISILAFVSSSATGIAQLLDVTLSTASLPSAQGWVYDALNSALSETQAFSTDGATLHMDTMVQGYQSQGHNYYRRPISSFAPGADWELTFRVRVPQYESQYADPTFNPFGFFVGVQFDGTGVAIGLTGAIKLTAPSGPGAILLFATAGWHDYRFVTNRERGTYSLFIDGILRSTGALTTDTTFPNGLYIGDTTGGENAVSDIASFRVFQRAPSQGTPVSAAIYRAVEVRWSTAVGKTYQVQSTPSLASPNWTDFDQPVTGDGLPRSIFDTTRDAISRFYRVIELQ